MTVIKCSKCGKNISSNAPDCPFCSPSPARRLSIAGIVIAAWYLSVLCVYVVLGTTAHRAPFGPPVYWSISLSPLAFIMSVSATIASFKVPVVRLERMAYIVANTCGVLVTGFLFAARLVAWVL